FIHSGMTDRTPASITTQALACKRSVIVKKDRNASSRAGMPEYDNRCSAKGLTDIPSVKGWTNAMGRTLPTVLFTISGVPSFDPTSALISRIDACAKEALSPARIVFMTDSTVEA